MLKVIVSFLVLCLGSTYASAQQIEVSKTQWDALKPEDRQAIVKLLQDSRLLENPDIVPSAALTGDEARSELGDELRDTSPQSADWFKKIIKVVTKKACEAGCEASGLAATSGCGILSGGVAAGVCGGLVNKAQPLCKKNLCK